MPTSTTTENHAITYPAEGATGWYATWETLIQDITDNFDNITNFRAAILKDTNGNEAVTITATGSAVNAFTIANAATGNAPVLEAEGEANIGMQLRDSNSNEVVTLASVASAVNEVTITNAATGNDPVIEPTGGDTNVNLSIKSKGSGTIELADATNVTGTLSTTSTAQIDGNILDSNGNEIIEKTNTASAVNHVKVTNAATGNDAALEAAGGDTNIDLAISGKGTGGVAIAGRTDAAAPAAGKVGEEMITRVLIASAVTLTNDGLSNVTSVTLTAGVWDLSGTIMFSATNASMSGLTTWFGVIGASSGTTTPIEQEASVQITGTAPDVGIGSLKLAISPVRVSISSSTTYYLNGEGYSASNFGADAYGTIRAIRVA
jgi:hypothetical protein